jgi:DNA-binding transcriptional LysR family regulator
MNLNQLQYFVSAAELQSFTKAAERHYISQTAITQQIRALEIYLDCDLFDRSKRPITLTPAGHFFLIEAKAILERVHTAVERTHDASVGMIGSLKIGYTKGYERSELSNRLRAFHNSFPNIHLSCIRLSTDRLAAGLLGQEYDIIFTWDSTNLRQNPQILWQEIERARLVVALYAGHPLAHRVTLRRSELKGETLLFMSPSEAIDSFGDSYYMQLYQNAGYQPHIIFRSSDAESILMMVAAEEGISILPNYFTNKLTNADNLVFIPLVGEEEVEEIVAMWQEENQNPALQRFLPYIR